MNRPTILDMDLVVVPREATERELRDIAAAARDFTTMPGLYPRAQAIRKAMLSASPYPTAWDDVRKYVDGLERERNESIARETDAWRRANRAESKVKAWEGFVVVRDLPRLAVQTKDLGPGEQDTVSVPKITPEKLTDIIDRADAAEARIAELEKRLADAERVIDLAEEYIIDGITTAKEQYEMNAPYPAREPRYRAALDDARAAHAAVRAYMEGK